MKQTNKLTNHALYFTVGNPNGILQQSIYNNCHLFKFTLEKVLRVFVQAFKKSKSLCGESHL